MALSLGWHIVIACFGVGFPSLILIAEWKGLRGDAHFARLARRWSKAAGVLFAIGAVSGTILSFEMGILWPGLIGTFGQVIGLPFALEGIAFFLEAIFLGIYLYGWDRLSPKLHLVSGIPIVIAGVASAWFVVTANAWMNDPVGFELVGGQVANVDPLGAMLSRATPVETTHMIFAAFMVTGFGVASVYAWAMLHGHATGYERRGFLLGFVAAALFTVPQIVAGDWSARYIAERQPAKLAAIEALYRTQRGAPLTLGGIPVGEDLRYGIQIPGALSLLAFHDPNAEVQGLDAVPVGLRPPVAPVHFAFQAMVAIGFGLLFLALWLAVSWIRRRDLPGSRWFLIGAVAAGPAAALALESGWIVTEVGRQPWIVYRLLLVEDAVTAAEGLTYGLFTLIVIYAALTVAAVLVLRRMGRDQLDAGVAAISPSLPR